MQPEFPQALPRRNASAEFPRPSEARDKNRFSDQNLRSFCLCCAIVIDLPKKKNRCSFGDSLLSFANHLAETETGSSNPNQDTPASHVPSSTDGLSYFWCDGDFCQLQVHGAVCMPKDTPYCERCRHTACSRLGFTSSVESSGDCERVVVSLLPDGPHASDTGHQSHAD